MQSLVLLPLTALEATLVGPLCAPVIIVVHTLPGLRFAQTVPCDGQKASVSSHLNELRKSAAEARTYGAGSALCHEEISPSRASIITLAHGQVWELSVVKREFLWAKKNAAE